MLKQLIIFVLAIVLFAGCTKSKSETNSESLSQLLIENPDSISGLTEEISKDESVNAIQLINEHLSKVSKQTFQTEWENETLVLGAHELRFKFKKFGEKPLEGWSLYISMHGGGGAPAAVNDQQWENQINLYQPKEGIYMAPRAPTDTWNLWHEKHIDEFFARFIQVADDFEDINTNRVYLTGYSAGGDGTYQLAPRMADCFAAAAMMAGHPNDASPLGLRNLPFAIQMGADDGAYDRNKIAANWGEKLDKLESDDPGAYMHKVNLYEGMGHWMERKDTAAVNWMGQFDRNAYPEKIVWKQSSVTHNRFYWLAVANEKAVKNAEIIVTRNGQKFSIEKAELVDDLIIRLNDEMLDLSKKVVVEYKGEEIYKGLVQRNVSTIWKSLNERNDLQQVFSAEIQVSLK